MTHHDQERVLAGVSFRAAEKFSLSRLHEAAAQFAESNPHCRHWRRKILIQVCSGSGLWLPAGERTLTGTERSFRLHDPVPCSDTRPNTVSFTVA